MSPPFPLICFFCSRIKHSECPSKVLLLAKPRCTSIFQSGSWNECLESNAVEMPFCLSHQGINSRGTHLWTEWTLRATRLIHLHRENPYGTDVTCLWSSPLTSSRPSTKTMCSVRGLSTSLPLNFHQPASVLGSCFVTRTQREEGQLPG